MTDLDFKTVLERQEAVVPGYAVVELTYRNSGDRAGWRWCVMTANRKKVICSGHELSVKLAMKAAKEQIDRIRDPAHILRSRLDDAPRPTNPEAAAVESGNASGDGAVGE